MDHRGATLVNHYWGVSLEVPEGAIAKGEEKQIYFVISDPRLCDNVPPLDLENGNPHGFSFVLFSAWLTQIVFGVGSR